MLYNNVNVISLHNDSYRNYSTNNIHDHEQITVRVTSYFVISVFTWWSESDILLISYIKLRLDLLLWYSYQYENSLAF